MRLSLRGIRSTPADNGPVDEHRLSLDLICRIHPEIGRLLLLTPGRSDPRTISREEVARSDLTARDFQTLCQLFVREEAGAELRQAQQERELASLVLDVAQRLGK